MGRILLRQFALSGRSETVPQSRPLVDPCSFDGPPEHACSPVSGREAIGRQNELVALGRLVEAFCEQFRQLRKNGNPASFLPLVALGLRGVDQEPFAILMDVAPTQVAMLADRP